MTILNQTIFLDGKEVSRWWVLFLHWSGETLPIRGVAVRETGSSRHHGGPIEGPLKPPPISTSGYYRTKGFKGGPQLDLHYAERHQPLRQPMWVIFQSGRRDTIFTGGVVCGAREKRTKRVYSILYSL